jgi:hypothetical protein
MRCAVALSTAGNELDRVIILVADGATGLGIVLEYVKLSSRSSLPRIPSPVPERSLARLALRCRTFRGRPEELLQHTTRLILLSIGDLKTDFLVRN